MADIERDNVDLTTVNIILSDGDQTCLRCISHIKMKLKIFCFVLLKQIVDR